mmetsp:Transcript_39326/g.113813  ORF Transcript_39326/g.113813 Transcript_39326/m.113813 type:complete len:623 (-) Transcript_39326:30-1898(-)
MPAARRRGRRPALRCTDAELLLQHLPLRVVQLPLLLVGDRQQHPLALRVLLVADGGTAAAAAPGRRRPQGVEIRRRVVVENPIPERLALHQHLSLLLRSDGLGLAGLRLGQDQLRQAKGRHRQVLELPVDGVLEPRQLVRIHPVGLQLVHLDEVGLVRLERHARVQLFKHRCVVGRPILLQPLRLAFDVIVNVLLDAVDARRQLVNLAHAHFLVEALVHLGVHDEHIVLSGFVQQDLVHPLDGVVLRLQPVIEGLDRLHAVSQLGRAILLEGVGVGPLRILPQAVLHLAEVLRQGSALHVAVQLCVDRRRPVGEAPDLVVHRDPAALEAESLLAELGLDLLELIVRDARLGVLVEFVRHPVPQLLQLLLDLRRPRIVVELDAQQPQAAGEALGHVHPRILGKLADELLVLELRRITGELRLEHVQLGDGDLVLNRVLGLADEPVLYGLFLDDGLELLLDGAAHNSTPLDLLVEVDYLLLLVHEVALKALHTRGELGLELREAGVRRPRRQVGAHLADLGVGILVVDLDGLEAPDDVFHDVLQVCEGDQGAEVLVAVRAAAGQILLCGPARLPLELRGPVRHRAAKAAGPQRRQWQRPRRAPPGPLGKRSSAGRARAGMVATA